MVLKKRNLKLDVKDPSLILLMRLYFLLAATMHELAWIVATWVKTLYFFQISLYLRAYVRVIHQKIKAKFPIGPSLEKQNIQGNIDITRGQGIGKYV